MEDTQLAQAAPESASAASEEAGKPSQIVMEDVTLDQLDELMTTGSAELPMTSDGGGKQDDPPAGKVEEAAGVKAAVTEDPPAKVDEDEVVEETRSAEEIKQAQDAAREVVIADGGDEAAQEAAAEEAGKPVAAAKAEDPPAPAKEPKTEEHEDSQRFRVKDPLARAALSVYKAMEAAGTPISLAEAEARVRGPEKKKEAVVETPALTEVVSTLESEVADLEGKIDLAGENEGLINKAFTDLTKQLAAKRTELSEAKRDLKEASILEQTRMALEAERSKTQRGVAKAEAFKDYPDAAITGSELDKAIQAEIAELNDPTHPDNAILFADSAPYLVTQRAAKKLGIVPVAQKAATPAVKAKVEAPLKTKLAPVSGGKTAVQQGELSEEAKAKQHLTHLQSPNATIEELDALFEPGGRSGTLAAVVG